MADALDGNPLTGPSRWTNWVILAVIVIGLYLIFRFRPFGSPDPLEHAGVGQPLRLLELRSLTDAEESVTLDDLAGQVVLVNFWGTWCPPCRRELPLLDGLRRKFAGNADFRLLAVSCGYDSPEDPKALREDTRAFLKQAAIDMPVYTDPGEVTRGAFAAITELDSFPTTFILDRNGLIRGVWPGFRPGIDDEMEELIVRLLDART